MAAPPVTTTVTELPESRVRVEAEVPAAEVERRMAQAARELARSIRVPGFRAGKAPPPVVIKRVGREAVLDEAVRGSIGNWYAAAIDDAHIAPVGEPDLDLSRLPGEGEPLRFSIEIGVRPKAQLGEYKGLEVGRREPDAGAEAIEAEIEHLRERSAKLETVDRSAKSGDFVVMDYLGSVDGTPFAGGEGRDQMVELGSGRLVPGFEDQLEGASAGDELTVAITFPADYGAAELAGKEAQFAVTVKEVKAKSLPAVDDELAAEAGFDTLDELRDDIRERLSERDSAQIEAEFRDAVMDSAVAAATVDVPETLIEARARERLEEIVHQLGHQGITREALFRMRGEEEMLEAGKEEASKELRREAVLAAIIEAEGIEATEDDVLEAVGQAADGGAGSPKKLVERLKSTGRLESLKQDLAQRKALDLISEAAKPISVEQAQARDKLWTPEKETDAGERSGGQLWTPGS